MGALFQQRMACVAAALSLILALGQGQGGGGAPAADVALPAVITAEGTAEAIEPRDVFWNVELNGAFAPTITRIVPEWSRVQAGDVIAELQTPWLEDEQRDKERLLRQAEAVARRTEAEAAAALGDLRAAVLAARTDLRGAEQHLAALQALPCAVDVAQLDARVAENEARRTEAKDRLDRMVQLSAEGLCSETELMTARHGCESRTADAAYLQSLGDWLRSQGSCFEEEKAAANVEKLRTRLKAAELRAQLESERRRLLCDASREKGVGQAKREYELSLKRTQALTVRAPAAGEILYGDRDGYWLHMEGQRFGPGAPVFYGQRIASVVDPGQVRVAAKVPEEELLRVKEGDRAEIGFPGVPDTVYRGAVESVLALVSTSRRETAETATQILDSEGCVLVAVSDAGRRVRPGMKADVRIFPGPDDAAAWEPVHRVPDSRLGRPALLLRGRLAAESTHQIRCPFQGRLISVVPAGTPVKEGEVVATLVPDLAVDWRAQDASELARLEVLRRASEIEVHLKEELVPLLVAEAEADVTLAQLGVEELASRPEARERIHAENERSEAEWQLEWAKRRLESCADLVAEGNARAADVRQAELQVGRAEATLAEKDAILQDILAGAAALERVAARAGLKRARAALARTRALAELDVREAEAELQTAGARLEAYRAQAERRLRKAGRAEIVSPVNGLVAWCWAEKGSELQQGWHFMGIADMEQAAVHAMLDESDYFKVRRGAPARLTLAGVPGRTFSGRVTDVVAWPELAHWTRQYVGETRVRDGRLFQVVVALDEEPPLCIGMSAMVEVFPLPEGAAATPAGEGEATSSEGASHG